MNDTLPKGYCAKEEIVCALNTIHSKNEKIQVKRIKREKKQQKRMECSSGEEAVKLFTT